MKLRDKIAIGCLGGLVLLLGGFMVIRDSASSNDARPTSSAAVDLPSAARSVKVQSAVSTPLTTQSVQPVQQREEGFLPSVKAWWMARTVQERILALSVGVLFGVVVVVAIRKSRGIKRELGDAQALLSQGKFDDLLGFLENKDSRGNTGNGRGYLLLCNVGKDNENTTLAEAIAKRLEVYLFGKNEEGVEGVVNEPITVAMLERFEVLMKAVDQLPDAFNGVKKKVQEITDKAGKVAGMRSNGRVDLIQGEKPINALAGLLDHDGEKMRQVEAWLTGYDFEKLLSFLRRGVNGYLLLLNVATGDHTIVLTEAIAEVIKREDDSEMSVGEEDDHKAEQEENSHSSETKGATMTYDQANGFFKLMQKSGYLPSDFEHDLEEMRKKATEECMVGLAMLLAQFASSDQPGLCKSNISNKRERLMNLIGVKEEVEKVLEVAKQDLNKGDWQVLLTYLQKKYYLLLFAYRKDTCLAEAIAAKIVGSKSVTSEQVFGFLKLMEKAGGYVPGKFKEYIATLTPETAGMMDDLDDREVSDGNSDHVVSNVSNNSKPPKDIKGELGKQRLALVSELEKLDKDDEAIKKFQEALMQLMKALGVGEVAEKMEEAYNHLQKAAWGSLLERLNSDPLHALLLLLKSGDGKGSCLADTMVKKVAHDKRVTCEQADGFLKLMQNNGYVPGTFEIYVHGLLEEVSLERFVALLGGVKVVEEKINHWLKESAFDCLLVYLKQGVNHRLFKVDFAGGDGFFMDYLADKLFRCQERITPVQADEFLTLMRGNDGNGYVPKGFRGCLKEVEPQTKDTRVAVVLTGQHTKKALSIGGGSLSPQVSQQVASNAIGKSKRGRQKRLVEDRVRSLSPKVSQQVTSNETGKSKNPGTPKRGRQKTRFINSLRSLSRNVKNRFRRKNRSKRSSSIKSDKTTGSPRTDSSSEDEASTLSKSRHRSLSRKVSNPLTSKVENRPKRSRSVKSDKVTGLPKGSGSTTTPFTSGNQVDLD